jgi:hypothetical protein
MNNQILIFINAFLMPRDGFSQKPQNEASNKIYKNFVLTDGRNVLVCAA